MKELNWWARKLLRGGLLYLSFVHTPNSGSLPRTRSFIQFFCQAIVFLSAPTPNSEPRNSGCQMTWQRRHNEPTTRSEVFGMSMSSVGIRYIIIMCFFKLGETNSNLPKIIIFSSKVLYSDKNMYHSFSKKAL